MFVYNQTNHILSGIIKLVYNCMQWKLIMSPNCIQTLKSYKIL